MKIVFMGTPDFSVPVFEELINNYEIVLAVTQPDKFVGRHQELKMTPIKEIALKNNIEVFQPVEIKDDYQKIISLEPDLIITCAYGQIIPKILLDCPKLGCINVHASLLPKLRGGAPIHHALIDGYDKTGITIMYMDEDMDNGDIILQKELAITDADNVGLLHDKLSKMGASLLIKTLPSIIKGTNQRIKQDKSLVTYGFNIKREEEKIDFNKTGREIFNLVRGLNPFPKAYLMFNSQEMKVLELSYQVMSDDKKIGSIKLLKNKLGIKVSDGYIFLLKVKPFGKKEMLIKDFLNGIDKEGLSVS